MNGQNWDDDEKLTLSERQRRLYQRAFPKPTKARTPIWEIILILALLGLMVYIGRELILLWPSAH